uniref:Glucosaminyl (N-acetyl) transferase 2 (I blood group) n=1 Tax=Eptatretus burgeri TaxID=7764 RepID=A0A8C4R5Z4_EPTBU
MQHAQNERCLNSFPASLLLWRPHLVIPQRCSLKCGEPSLHFVFFIFLLSGVICFFVVFLGNQLQEGVIRAPSHWDLQLAECGDYPSEICRALFQQRPLSMRFGKTCQDLYRTDPEPSKLQGSVDCRPYIQKRGYITQPMSEEEKNFPLAFVMTIHKDFSTFEVLLRNIYHPQNIYCVHIDAKSEESFKQQVANLVGCFENVFLVSHSEDVVYAGFSRLQADINCLRDLMAAPTPWNVVLNLCGQDFPLRTNLEIVQLLSSVWWRRNITPGIPQPKRMAYRTNNAYQEHLPEGGRPGQIRMNGRRKGPPPHNLTLFFGSAYYVLTRSFVSFVLSDQRALDLLDWSKDTYSPDEHYWVTLNHLPDAPGSVGSNITWHGNVKLVKWKDQEKRVHNGCGGHYLHNICVYGLGDLPWLINKTHIFANKFEAQTYPLALECMERWHRGRLLDQAVSKGTLPSDNFTVLLGPVL